MEKPGRHSAVTVTSYTRSPKCNRGKGSKGGQEYTHGDAVDTGEARAVVAPVPGPVRVRLEQRPRVGAQPAGDGAQPGRHPRVADVRQEHSTICNSQDEQLNKRLSKEAFVELLSSTPPGERLRNEPADASMKNSGHRERC